MLQQTQVSTVWPYYRRWMETFPSISILAQAQLDQVLKIWEGLGYYSRARNLHKAAAYIMQEYAGELPRTAKKLIQIPGVGPYTAAAVASLAYNETVPLIDGNVLRVVSRLQQITEYISRAKTKAKILKDLKALISGEEPGLFNQSLMDLGRVICTPKAPKCHACPVSSMCQAYAAGDMLDYPVKPRKAPIPHYNIVIGLIQKSGEVLIQKRPANGLLGGLWEFPGGKIKVGESEGDALLREIKEETGLDVNIGEKIGSISHAYTHFKISMSAYYCIWKTGNPEIHAATENRWVAQKALNDYAFPKANLKILDLIAS